MYRRDEKVGKDPTIVRKTQSFNLPVRILRAGQYRGLYKVPSGSMILSSSVTPSMNSVTVSPSAARANAFVSVV